MSRKVDGEIAGAGMTMAAVETPSGKSTASENFPVGSFLLTSLTDTAAIIEQQRRCRTNTIQICDRITRERDMVIAGPSNYAPRFLNSLIIAFGTTFCSVVLGVLAVKRFHPKQQA